MKTEEFQLDQCCEHCGGSLQREGDSLRCACGSLLARFVAGGLELKCRRCKRTVTVPAPIVKGSAIGP